MTGAQFEISIDGVPRTYRDQKELALLAAQILKSRNSNVDRQRHVHRDRVGVVGHGAFCPIDSGQGRAYIAAGYAYRSAFHRALCLPTVRAGGPPRGQEDWGQGRL